MTFRFTMHKILVQVPFTFKYAVDALTLDSTGATAAAMPLITLLPATVLLGYGAARAGAALCNEARNAVFAKARTLLQTPGHHSEYFLAMLASIQLLSSGMTAAILSLALVASCTVLLFLRKGRLSLTTFQIIYQGPELTKEVSTPHSQAPCCDRSLKGPSGMQQQRYSLTCMPWTCVSICPDRQAL